VRQAPDNPTARFNLGSLLLTGNPAEALEHLAAAVRLRPEDAEARRLLARTLRDAGRLDEALEQYAQAVRANPADDTAWMGEAETLVRLERYREALARLEAGLEALPSSQLLARGVVRLLAACPDRSLRDGAVALDLAAALREAAPTPDHAELQALALAELGRCGEAAERQRTALAEARQAGLDARLPTLSAALARYESGACRP
jgi:tetratricopeptide (TPR) repeat protein